MNLQLFINPDNYVGFPFFKVIIFSAIGSESVSIKELQFEYFGETSISILLKVYLCDQRQSQKRND